MVYLEYPNRNNVAYIVFLNFTEIIKKRIHLVVVAVMLIIYCSS